VKISLPDRYEALRRHPGYCRDWEAWQRTSDKGNDDEFENATKQLKSKYRIPRIPTPLVYPRPGKPKIKPTSIEVIPSPKPKNLIAPQHWDGTLSNFPWEVQRLTKDDFLEERRYLHLKVDLEEPLPILEKDFKETVKEWRKHLASCNGWKERRGKTTVDPWEVYDLIEYHRKSITSIAKERTGINKNPAYNARVASVCRQVERAYKKAKEMINVFGSVDV